MLSIKPTEHLLGITIQGDYDDLQNMVDSINRITGLDDDPEGMYYGVKDRLRGICYDIRNACQPDGQTKPVKILFPEALFVAASVPKMCIYSRMYYGGQKADDTGLRHPLSKFYMDRSNLDHLCAGIWSALEIVAGEAESDKILQMYERENEPYQHYAVQYIDRCNVELVKTPFEKRGDKLRNIAKRIVKKSSGYNRLESDVKYWAKEHKTSIYKLYDPGLEFPEAIDW